MDICSYSTSMGARRNYISNSSETFSGASGVYIIPSAKSGARKPTPEKFCKYGAWNKNILFTVWWPSNIIKKSDFYSLNMVYF